MFRPYQFRIMPPSGDTLVQQGPQSQQTSVVANVRFPIGTTVDLSTIPVGGVKDFFLWQPYQGSLDAVFVGASSDVDLGSDAAFQLVQINGASQSELTSSVTLRTVGIEPTQIADDSAKVLDGPVFLRVTMPAVAVILFVTVHSITPEIP